MDDVNQVATALGLEVERRLAGSEFGAYLARTHGSEPVVLKLSPGSPQSSERVQAAVDLASTLRQGGYPIPRYLDVGMTHGRVYTLQEAVEGEVPDILRPAHARQLVDLWRRHEGQAGSAGASGAQWVSEIVDGLRVGSSRLVVDHAAIRDTGDSGALEVLEAARTIGEGTELTIFRTGDVVHQDFHHRNLLVRGDEVVAVLDWEGAHAGDSRADLLCLEFSARNQADPAALTLLAARVATTVPADVRAAMYALLALQGLSYAARSKPDKLEHFVEVARALMRQS